MQDLTNFSNENLTNTRLSDNILTEKMLIFLKGASPWLRCVGIAGFVSMGLTFFSLLAMGNSDSFDSLGMDFESGPFFFITTIPFLAISFFCSFNIFRFGSRIKRYFRTKDPAELESAFKHNKTLWTLLGVLCIFFLIIFSLAMLMAMMAGLFENSW